MKHAPPSARVIYHKLEGDHIMVRYLYGQVPLVCAPGTSGADRLVGADGVRGRGEAHEYDETGQVVLSSSRGAAPPRIEPPEPERVGDVQTAREVDRLRKLGAEPMALKPSKVLMAAADLLERGWCQRSLGIRDRASCWQAARKKLGLPILYTAAHEFQLGVEIDRVCLQRALLKAAVDLSGVGWPAKSDHAMTPEQEAMRASYGAAEQAVAEEICDTGFSSVARWNDAPGRTQAEVVALVLDVAAQEEAAGR